MEWRSNGGKSEGSEVGADGEEVQRSPGHHQSLHLCTYSHRQLWRRGVGRSHARPGPMMCKPFLTFDCAQENCIFVRGTVFITHTVGLCLPLWSLMLGEGLCPAANEYAAPSTDDCGGGGGGGGSASCKKNNREIIGTKRSNISLPHSNSASPPSESSVKTKTS